MEGKDQRGEEGRKGGNGDDDGEGGKGVGAKRVHMYNIIG